MIKHFAMILIFSGLALGQTWSGVLAPERAIDWTGAGVIGGIPSSSWTQCGATVTGGSSGSPTSTATVQAAITACTANHYVKLGTGFFQTFCSTKSSVAIRGSGADQTFITGSSSNCQFYGSMITLSSPSLASYMSPSTIHNWTSGYAKGSTVLTMDSTSGFTANSTLIMLDQTNDATDTGNFFVNGGHPYITASEDPSAGSYRSNRSQQQIVMPTAVGGGTITIPNGVYAPQWASGKSPQAWVIGTALQLAGIEDLSITAGGAEGINIVGCYGCWVKGVKSTMSSGKSHVHLILTAHTTVMNNYLFGPTSGDPYCVYNLNTTDNLIVNNIIQQCHSPVVWDSPATGDVIAYNYTVNNDPGQGWFSFWQHNAGNAYNLIEGNMTQGWGNDDIHGTSNMATEFRNYFTGANPAGTTSQGNPFFDGAYQRYSNIVGNVLGTPSVTNTYVADYGNPPNMAYVLGWGNGIPNDPVVPASAMRWGNYDVVTGTSRFCSAASPCSGSNESGNGASTYPALTSPSSTLPVSFYYSSKPAWWPTGKAWPAIGPDVTGGNISNTAGHVFTNPAADCFLTTMGGVAAGTGGALTFNEDTCYTSSSATADLSPTSHNFGNLLINTSSSGFVISMINNGTVVLNISSVTLTGTNSNQFSISNNTCGATLAGAASCSATITFSPTSSGSKSANLTFVDDAGTQNAALTGNGTAPVASLSPSSLGFGSITIGSTSSGMSTSLSNTGDATMTLTSFTLTGTDSGMFSIFSNTCGGTLAASTSCTITIKFSPSSTGAKSASLSVVDSASGSPHTVSLSGTGIVNPTPSTTVTVGGSVTVNGGITIK